MPPVRHRCAGVLGDIITMLEQSIALVSAGRHSIRSGDNIYRAGTTGTAWRVAVGSIRLDQEYGGESSFAGLAVPGDIIGAETLIFSRYSFTATALSQCVLIPWPESAESLAGETLLHTLAKSEHRAAEVIALRSGVAMERVKRLLGLLTRCGGADRLPSLRDMADITALRLETVSRMLGVLRKTGAPGAEHMKRGRRPSHHRNTLTAMAHS